MDYKLYTVIKVISSEWQCQKVLLSIIDMFVIDHKEKVSLINSKIVCALTRNIFLCNLSQTFFLIVMKECRNVFVINCGKGCLCDGCLGLITEVFDKSKKRPKSITQNSSVVYHIVRATLCD